MGLLYYGSRDEPISIDDRALAHLKVVVITKLRRGESFTVSWQHPDTATGRSTIWLHPAIPLRFEFQDAEPPTLNRQWLEDLADHANGLGGIQLTDESHPAIEETTTTELRTDTPSTAPTVGRDTGA